MSVVVPLILTSICLRVASAIYSVPNPKIQIYEKGFTVSIPDDAGITVFAFHGNINRHMKGLEAGQFSRDVLVRTNDKWVFTDFDSEMKTGDVIYYWLFVIKDGLGYRYDNGVYIVHEILKGRPSNFEWERPGGFCLHDLDLFNLTKTIISLQNEVEKLRESNGILTSIIDNNSEKPHALKLTGVLPPSEDSLQVVQDILDDKLGLKIKIEQARRNDDRTITFTVQELKDKISVIQSAKEKLRNSRIGLSY